MNCKIENIISELKQTNLVVGKKVTKKTISLFEEQYIIDISFNGFHDLEVYDIHLQSVYRKCMIQFDKKLNYNDSLIRMNIHLELARFEIQQAKKTYLSDTKQLIKRIHVEKAYKLNDKYEEQLIEMLNHFFEIKIKLANNLIAYFKHRIDLLNRFRMDEGTMPSISYKKKEVQNTNQRLSFTKNNSPKLVWDRSSTDFMELLHALSCTNSFKNRGGELSRKDLTDFFTWLFNFEIKDPNGTLRAAKKRKKLNTPFLKELAKAFEDSAEDLFA